MLPSPFAFFGQRLSDEPEHGSRLKMFQKLEDVERRYVELETALVDPATIGHRKDYARLAKERSDLEEIVAALSRMEAALRGDRRAQGAAGGGRR